MGLLRSVAVPTPGRLYLGAMPGRREPFAEALRSWKEARVGHLVVLTSRAEIEGKAPEYGRALAAGLPLAVDEIPVPDFGVPRDEAAYRAVVARVGEALRRGTGVFVHCGAGRGRTGTFAACVLAGLGVPEVVALDTVAVAGSGPETEGQRSLVTRMAMASGAGGC